MIVALVLAAALQHWLVVNDIHLDPFSHEGIVRGADTTPALWQSAMGEMRRDVPNPRVVVLGGDELAHHFTTLALDARASADVSALRVDRLIARDLGSAYPNAQFLVAQGNNDDPCGDYKSETSGSYLRALERIWQPLVDRNGAAPDFAAQFMHGGYYAARLPIAGGKAIVLNSVFWSILYSGGCGAFERAPERTELAWLNQTLASMPRGTNAVVLLHVPPGYDPTATMIAHRFISVPFLTPRSGAALLSALAAHAAQIRAIYGAHTHRYDFRIVSGIPMLIASSISPVYTNNPAFYDVTVDGRGDIVDVQPYAYDLIENRWMKEPSFDRMYGVHAFTAATLASIASRIQSDPQVRAIWKAAFDVWSWRVGDLDNDWLPFACAQTQLGRGYAACAHTTRRTLSLEVLAGIIALVAIAAFAWWLRVRLEARRSL